MARIGGTLITTFAAIVAVAGCGARPPQPPSPTTKELNSATGAISSACGRSYRVTAFGDERRRVRALDEHARPDARSLASVYRRNPDWIYQGQTIAETADQAISLLRDCGLRRSAAILARATRSGGG